MVFTTAPGRKHEYGEPDDLPSRTQRRQAAGLRDHRQQARPQCGVDYEILASELKALDPEFEVELTGFSLAEADLMIDGHESGAAASSSRKKVPDRAGPVVSRAGDEWAIGEHRLLCGANDALCDRDCAVLRANDRSGGNTRRYRAKLFGAGQAAWHGDCPMSEKKQAPGATQLIVGYRKPPVHTRFRKGQSGNPGGRPRGMTRGRAAALLEKELYRPVKVKIGKKVETMPALQVAARQLITLGMSGNTSALRSVVQWAQEIDKLAAQQALLEGSTSNAEPVYILLNEADRTPPLGARSAGSPPLLKKCRETPCITAVPEALVQLRRQTVEICFRHFAGAAGYASRRRPRCWLSGKGWFSPTVRLFPPPNAGSSIIGPP